MRRSLEGGAHQRAALDRGNTVGKNVLIIFNFIALNSAKKASPSKPNHFYVLSQFAGLLSPQTSKLIFSNKGYILKLNLLIKNGSSSKSWNLPGVKTYITAAQGEVSAGEGFCITITNPLKSVH